MNSYALSVISRRKKHPLLSKGNQQNQKGYKAFESFEQWFVSQRASKINVSGSSSNLLQIVSGKKRTNPNIKKARFRRVTGHCVMSFAMNAMNFDPFERKRNVPDKSIIFHKVRSMLYLESYKKKPPKPYTIRWFCFGASDGT